MIEVEKNNHIFEIYIKTDELNSLDEEFFGEFIEVLKEAESDRKNKAILLSARGDKFFSNGFNPKLFLGKEKEEIKLLVTLAMEASSRLLFSNRPVVCAMNGHAMGVGAVFAVFSDYRLLIEKQGRIAFPESMIGLNFPSASCHVLRELIGIKAATDLLFTGRGVKASEALTMGLIDEIAPSPEELLPLARKWCAKFEKMAIESVTGLKISLRDSTRLTVDILLERDIELLTSALLTKNGQEGLKSIQEGRRAKFV